jgi:hypothetical protein
MQLQTNVYELVRVTNAVLPFMSVMKWYDSQLK